MADKKISQLTDGTSLQSGDFVVIARSGDNFKVDPTQFSDFDLTAISTTIADTAVDVFVYDTSRDSDGGAWRHRTQHTSWYNETLNTATRGSRREFPAVAVIVAESGQVTIYDGDDPSLPMWMVFNTGTNYYLGGNSSAGSLYAYNGIMCVGFTANTMVYVGFISDEGRQYQTGGNIKRSLPISYRNVTNSGFFIGGSIVNNNVNDVAMTVLPNAPIDTATGLPVPTIAVATDGGVSVITDSGAVYDSATTLGIINVNFSSDGLYYTRNTYGAAWFFATYADIDAGDGFGDQFASSSAGAFSLDVLAGAVSPNSFSLNENNLFAAGAFASGAAVPGLQIANVDPSDFTKSMSALVTSSYNTGWMNGDIKLATLSDTDDTDVTGSELVTNGTFDTDTDWLKDAGWTISGGELVATSAATASATYQNFTTVVGRTYTATVDCSAITAGAFRFYYRIDGGAFQNYVDIVAGETTSLTFTASTTSSRIVVYAFGTSSGVFDNVSVRLAEPDRSVNGNGLQVYGTITKDPVATGADLVAYSGFSAANYLEQPYNSDLDFGTGDFCVMGWTNQPASVAYRYLLQRDSASSAARFHVVNDTDGVLKFVMHDGSSGAVFSSGYTSNGSWVFLTIVRRSGVVYVYANGKLGSTTADTKNITNTAASLYIGIDAALSGSPTNGGMALLRISATAPTAEQIAKIYEDEKFLFQDGAQATLYGASDAVTALAHDEVTDLLHVGTSAGRSVFQGLRRVDNTTDAVGAAISAYDGLVAED